MWEENESNGDCNRSSRSKLVKLVIKISAQISNGYNKMLDREKELVERGKSTKYLTGRTL